MDSRSMLKVFTIAYCIVYCSADINKEEHVVDDKSKPATAGKAMDEISDLASMLFSALDKKNGTIGNLPASMIDLKAFEGKALSDITESLKNAGMLDEKNMKSFKDSFKNSDDKLDVKTLTEIKDFFQDKSIFGDLDTSDVTKSLDDKTKELEREINKGKKKNGGEKIVNGILPIVISLFIVISSMY